MNTCYDSSLALVIGANIAEHTRWEVFRLGNRRATHLTEWDFCGHFLATKAFVIEWHVGVGDHYGTKNPSRSAPIDRLY